MFAEGHQISAEIRKELNPPLLRVYLLKISWTHTIQCHLGSMVLMPSFSTGGSHSLMMVLSEHLDLFTPLAGSRLIGRVDWESRLLFGFSLVRWVFFCCGDFWALVMHVFTLKPFLNLTTGVGVYIWMYTCTCTYICIYIYTYIVLYIQGTRLAISIWFFLHVFFVKMQFFRCLGGKTAQLPFLGLAILGGFLLRGSSQLVL